MRLFPALLLCAALPVMAQTMKPGLWEVSQKAQLSPDQQAKMDSAQKQMAHMPPEQRKMMEQMMASHGVQMNMAGGTITIKSCVSAEQSRQNTPPMASKGNCTHDVKRSGNTINVHFACTNPVSETDSEVTLLGNGDGYTNKTRITHQRNGKPETITVSGEAHWLGTDCGGLKPMAVPAAK